MIKRLWQRRLPLPTLCAICRCWSAQALCTPCLSELGPVIARCPSCALPLAPGLALCAHCAEYGRSPLLHAYARIDYAWPWVHWIQQWKFHQHIAWSAEWARIMRLDPVLLRVLTRAEVWIPIPLTPARQSERGFNQAWELMKQLHPISPQAVLQPHVLVRHPTERLQHQLSRQERLLHAHQALSLDPSSRAAIQGRRIVLIDDVMTTGATLYAAAQHLLDAGAQEVSSVALARTPLGTTRIRPMSPQDDALLLS